MNPNTQDMAPERRRVLIVDDDPTMVHVLARSLMNCAQLYFSVRGEDALKKLEAHLPDLMLIDVDMPDLDGYEVMARMLQNPRTRNTKVIMVTSHSEDTHRRRAMELGAVDFFLKPIDRVEIRERVDQLINQPVESIELSFSERGDFTSVTATATIPTQSPVPRQGRRSAQHADFAPTDILDTFPAAQPVMDLSRAVIARASVPPSKPKPRLDSDAITSELFERMSAILEQTESMRHTERKLMSAAAVAHISRIEEECAEVIQLLVTLSDGAA